MLALPSSSVALMLTLAWAAGLSAQAVHVVDANGGAGSSFTEIKDAVVAAGEGDTILVRSGSYDPIEIVGKSLVIEGDAGAAVVIRSTFMDFASPHLEISELQAGQSVTVRGLDFSASFLMTSDSHVEFRDNSGTIWLENCETFPTFSVIGFQQVGLTSTDCAGVTLANCAIAGSITTRGSFPKSTPGIASTNTNLSLWNTTVVGCQLMLGDISGFPYPGGPGVSLDGGCFYASGCSITGGFGGDSTNGSDGADGGSGLELIANAPSARVLDTTLIGGIGGQGDGAGTIAGSDGQSADVQSGTLTMLDGDARSFDIASPVRAGTEALIETTIGQTGDVVSLGYSLGVPSEGVYLAVAKGNLVIAAPLTILPKGVIDSSGTLVTTPSTAPLPAGVETLPVYVQCVVLSANGGGAYLTGPSFLSLLSSSF